MYYEEKMINGTLQCRTLTTGRWYPITLERLSQRIVDQEKIIKQYQLELLGKNADGLGAK